MKNLLHTITLLLLCTGFAICQRGNPNKENKAVKLVGLIVDMETKVPMEFATISALTTQDSSIVTGGLSDLDGRFELSVPKGEYIIKTEFISYQANLDNIVIDGSNKQVDMGSIELSPESNFLNDIEIVSERSETSFALDKRVFTVGKDLANRGGSAEDILDNVPSITVDIEGEVSLRGSAGVKILIDGRPSGMAGMGNTNGLRNIPANMIERVEVITNPSSRYEASGMAGIINIILKKNESSGFNGSFDLTTGYPETLGGSANVNYRKGKLNWFLNYGVRYRVNPGGGFRIQDQKIIDSLNNDLRQLSIQDRQQDRKSVSNSIRFGADYFLTEKEQLTAAFLYRRSDENNLTTLTYEDYVGTQNLFSTSPLWENSLDDLKNYGISDFDSENNPLYNIDERTDKEKEDEKNLEYSLNYRKEFGSREHNLNAIVQFTEKSEVESSEFTTQNLFSIDPTNVAPNQKSNNDESESTWLFQLDYVHPLGKDHKYELGIRSSLRQISNDFLVEEQNGQNFFPIQGLNNNFVYDEDVHAAYAIYGNTFSKFSYQLGLRTELSRINTQLLEASEGGINKRSYNDLFPSGFLSYNFNESSAVQASYSRRIQRPRFWDLNPFFTFSDNRNFFSGNPNLNPEYTDSYEIGQLKIWDNVSMNSSLFYRITDASRQRIVVINNLNSTTLTLPINVGQVTDMGLDMSGSYSGIKWLRLDANINVFRNQVKLDPESVKNTVYENYRIIRNYSSGRSAFDQEFNISVNETDNITWNGRLTSRFTFWESDLQLRMNYRGPRESTQGARKAIGSLDIGWSKDLLGKSMTLTLSVRDLFNTRKRNGVSLLDEFADRYEFQWRSRVTTITASYRINQKKKRASRGRGDSQEGGEF